MDKKIQNKNCKICFCAALGGILFLVVLGGHLWMTIEKVRTGHGLEIFYFTFYSPRLGMSYLSALIYYTIFAVVVLFLPLINWFSTKEERDFKKKYHIDDK